LPLDFLLMLVSEEKLWGESLGISGIGCYRVDAPLVTQRCQSVEGMFCIIHACTYVHYCSQVFCLLICGLSVFIVNAEAPATGC